MSDLEDGQGGEGDVTQGEVTVALQDSHGVAEPVHVSADLCTGGGDDDLDAGDLSLDELNDNILDLGDNLSLEGREKQADECSGGDCGESAASDSTSKCSQSADTDPGDSDHTKAPSSGNSDQNTTPSIESLDITGPNSIVDTHVKKRNSLEVRNNIPDVNEVKNYDGDLGFDLKKMQAQGAVPKMKKKSPGLARRLADPLEIDDRDTSSSERETESALIDTSIISAQKDYESQLRNGSASILHYAPKSRVPPTDAEQCPTVLDKSSTRPDSPQDSPADPASFQPIDSPSSQPPGRRSESPEDLHRRKEASLPQRASSEPPQTNHVEAKFKLDDDAQSQDVENEYDYVKYSGIQQGDSYVGMRLAYSSSNDSLSLKRSLNMARGGSEDDQYCISSQEQSPKKLLSGGTSNNHMINDQIIRVGKVNEETLTEIPLNGDDNLLPEEQKNFSLSPEATECDSAEVESVLSDEGGSSTSGMPLVEDGLSSSQGSDTEDAPTYDMQRPAEILKRRFKAQMESELQQHPPDGMDSDGRSCSATDDNSSQMSSPSKDGQRRDEVDLALQDIQTAIQRSKGVTLKSAYDHQQEEEPVWVMRYVEPQVADSYVRKIQRHDELRQMRSAEDTPQEEELSKEKPDQVYNPEEDEDNLLKYQYSRHENKAYPQSRGFESDDDYEEHDRHIIEQTRRNQGNKYGAVPVDDPNSAARRGERVQTSAPRAATSKPHPLSAHSDTNLNNRSSHHSSTSSLDSGGIRSSINFSSSLSHSRYYPNASTGTINSSHSEPANRKTYTDSKAMSTSSDNNVGYNKNSPLSRGQTYTQREEAERSEIYNMSPYHDRCYHQNDPSYQDNGTPYQDNGTPYQDNGTPYQDNDTPYQDNDTAYHDNEGDSARGPPVDSPQAPPADPPCLREGALPGREAPLGEVVESEEEYQEEIFNRKPAAYIRTAEGDFDTDEETDELLDKQYASNEKVDIPELGRPPVNRSAQAEKRRSRAREVTLRDPDDETVLIEGVLFRARYLGSTQLISEGNPSKSMRMMQAQEAVGRIKAPEGESQPSTEVDLFVSVEKIMVLNTDLQEIMMDHALRTISYIADIGDILVIMARRGPVTSPSSDGRVHKHQSKICCHVFESEEAQLIAQSMGQAFQVAYMEFLKANGIDDPGLMKEMDYQEVLNQQEIYGEELGLFSNKEMQKEVIVPKLKNEPLGVVIVESGWGSMVPTVVLANMAPSGAAARCGQLNIGDQIMSINGVSLVGLPLSSCQNYIKAAKNQTVVKLNVVSCPPVVEVLIKRPDVKYQLGFSVQNGVICSLLRGGIAERGGVRVGHRIIEINSSSVVAVPHEKIVSMLATSVGEIHMKTMPTSIFRLLTGQDTPHFM